MKDELAILHESAPLLRSTILVRAGLSPAVQAQLKHILLAMDSEQNGRDVLAEYYKVAKYDEIDGAAADSLANARTLYPLVAAEIR
jgi:ABC-type phosphate/phosphonate transport system substrate-binding protein